VPTFRHRSKLQNSTLAATAGLSVRLDVGKKAAFVDEKAGRVSGLASQWSKFSLVRAKRSAYRKESIGGTPSYVSPLDVPCSSGSEPASSPATASAKRLDRLEALPRADKIVPLYKYR